MKILIRSLLAKGKGLGSLKKNLKYNNTALFDQGPDSTRVSVWKKKKETHWWGSVSMLFIVRTYLTSRPTWNDSTGRCSHELTNIKYLTGEPMVANCSFISQNALKPRTQTIIIFADRENLFSHLFFFSLLLCDSEFSNVSEWSSKTAW